MIRRILLIGGIGLTLAVAARLALVELAERAWDARKPELAALAVPAPALRRPWELRFEALQARVTSSPRFDELVDSPHRPTIACGEGEPRPLGDLERVWVEAAWTELAGLEPVLADLRRVAPEDLAWGGETGKLLFLRECVNVLCARAWLALERGDAAGGAEAFADALRLGDATDDRTTIGTMIRYACALTSLGSARSSLDAGLSPRALATALAPVLDAWSYSPERAAHGIGRELALVLSAADLGEPWDDPVFLRAHCAPVEEALALARAPLASTPWAREAAAGRDVAHGSTPLEQWTAGARQLHALHALRNVALTALSVAAHREAHGAWPASLTDVADLRQEWSLDTLAGRPLAYSAAGETARIGPATWGERIDRWSGEGESPYAWTLRVPHPTEPSPGS